MWELTVIMIDIAHSAILGDRPRWENDNEELSDFNEKNTYFCLIVLRHW